MNMTKTTRCLSTLRATALFAAALITPWFAAAASLEIDPVRIELSPKQQTVAITIRNSSDQPTTLEIKPVAWTQVDAKDIYTPTRELLVSPPLVTIPAHGEQVIRAALRRKADPSKELSYRINLQELPPAPLAGATGVQVALRIGLPVFVKPTSGKATPKMEWKLMHQSDGSLKVGFRNAGNAHIQISDFSLHNPGSNGVIAEEQGSSYILAGQAREWDLKTNPAEKIAGNRLRLKAFTDAGDADKELPLEGL
jgi:fimbrial chaperone protein